MEEVKKFPESKENDPKGSNRENLSPNVHICLF